MTSFNEIQKYVFIRNLIENKSEKKKLLSPEFLKLRIINRLQTNKKKIIDFKK